jgi:cyclopropane-fatty-acyl-phospholipid synthase
MWFWQIIQSSLQPIARRYIENNLWWILAKAEISLGDLHMKNTYEFYNELAKGILEHGGLTARLGELYVCGDWNYEPWLDVFFEKLTASTKFIDWKNNHPLARVGEMIKRMSPRKPESVGEEHYDIPLKVYGPKLGSTWKYTAAEYNPSLWTFDLDKNQKLAMAMFSERAELEKGMGVLEVGFWYGTLADYMIRNKGVSVTGLTVSKEQIKFANEYLSKNRTNSNANFKLLDWKVLYTSPKYREEFEQNFKWKFDRVISIEMIEAVSTDDLPLFFRFLYDCLSDEWLVFLQAINSDRLTHTTDGFIDKYIFTDGVVPQHANLLKNAEKGGFAQETSHKDIATKAYDKTLMAWWDNLSKQYPEFGKEMDFFYNKRKHNPFPYKDTPSFLKIFEYYLKSCAGSFRSGYNRDGQYKFYKSATNKVRGIVPATQEQMDRILQTKDWWNLSKAV